MKNLFFLPLIVLLGACQQEREPTIEELTQNIQQLNRQMEKAFDQGDLLTLARIYGDDAYLLGPGNYKVTGRKAIDDYWQRFKNPIQWKLDVIKVAQKEEALYETDYWKNMKNKPPHWNGSGAVFLESDQFLYQLGHSKLEYESEDATHQISHVDFIIVWKKQEDGNYKIFIDTYCSNN